MTMSTYKSLGGPASGLIVTNDADIAKRLETIAFPGLTANFDAAKSAALAITMLDWKVYGWQYAAEMAKVAKAFATALSEEGIPIFAKAHGMTTSHQFAIEAGSFGGGQASARLLRQANILACGIGLPIAQVEGDMNGLRIGTPEIVRWGMKASDVPQLAKYIAETLKGDRSPEAVSKDVANYRKTFNKLHFIR